MLSWEHNNFNEVIANSLVTKEARLERERKREYDKLIIAQEEEQKRIKEEEKKQRIIDEAKKRDIENKKYEEDLAKAKEWAAKKMQNEINAKLEAENNKKILEEYKTEQNRIKEELAKVQAHFENISQHEDVFGLFDTYENPVSPIYSDISELFAPNDTYIKNQSESFQNNSNDLLEKLVKKISKRKPIPKKIRGEAWKIQFGESTKGACFCCKKELDSFDDWHAGHIIAHAEGGTDTAANLRPVCGSCNHSMGTENMDAFKARCYPN